MILKTMLGSTLLWSSLVALAWRSQATDHLECFGVMIKYSSWSVSVKHVKKKRIFICALMPLLVPPQQQSCGEVVLLTAHFLG